MEQKYGKVPGVLKVKENCSSVSSTLDLNTLSGLTTVCGISSRFVHRTVVPALTVSSAGPNVKLSILTSIVSGFVCALALTRPTSAPSHARPSTNAVETTFIDTLRMMLFPFLRKRRVHDGESVLASYVGHVGDAEDALELLRRH